MDSTLRVILIIVIIVYFAGLFNLLIKKKLILKYTLLWLFVGLIMLLAVIFPRPVESFMHILGIVELTNGLFAIAILGLVIIAVSITSIVSSLNERIRKLIQVNAILEKRVRELESKKQGV